MSLMGYYMDQMRSKCEEINSELPQGKECLFLDMERYSRETGIEKGWGSPWISENPNYNDYPTWMELEKKGKVEKGTANKRRRLYKIRHKKDKDRKGTPGYFADKLLW